MVDAGRSQGPNKNTADRRSWRKELLAAFLLAILVLVVLALFVPVLDGPHRRQYANEAATASKLRWLNEAQKAYAAGHASGFACQLRQLRPSGPARLDSFGYPYDENEHLTSDESSGYLFTISACQADAGGRVNRYQITATPKEPGKTGFKAFCADESGVTWLNDNGSAARCLLERRPIGD